MQTAFINGRVMTSRGAIEDCAVMVEGKHIAELVRRSHVPADARKHDLAGRILLPGFIDSQVNGGGGVLFGDAPCVATLRTIAEAHARFGTTAFLPTLISGDLQSIRAAISAVDAAGGAGGPGGGGGRGGGPGRSPARGGGRGAAKVR